MRFLKEAKEKYKNWEIGLILMAIVLIIIFGIQISNFKVSYEPKSTSNYLARIVRLYGNVKFKPATQSYFDTAKLDYEIQNNGEVYTDINSEAIIKLLDSKINIELRPLTLIKILDKSEQVSLELIDGVINVELNKGNELWLWSNNEKILLKAQKENMIISAYLSEGKIVISSEELIKNKDDDFKVLTPLPGEKIEADEMVKIKMANSGKYNIQLSNEPSFNTIIATTEMVGTNYNWNLSTEEGLYYIKITLEDRVKIFPIYLESKFKITGIRPKDGETINLFPGSNFQLSWNPAGANSYRIRKRDSFGLEESYYTSTNDVEISNVKGETIEVLISPEIESNKFSNIRKKVRLGLNFTGSILLKQDQLQDVYLENTGANSISWEGREDELYRVRIIDLEKDKEVGVKNTTTNSLVLPKLNVGSYRLEISSVNYPTMRKAIYTFNIKTPIVRWNENVKSVIETENVNEKIKLDYTFNANEDLEPQCEIKYYSDDGVTMTEKKLPLKESAYFEAFGFGKYCLQIKPGLYSKNITSSGEICFLLKRKSKFEDIPVVVQENIKKVKNKHGTFLVNVPKIKNATRYIVETYKEKGQEKTQFDSKNNIIELDLRNIEEIYIRYKVSDKDNNESNFSPMAKVNLK